MENISFKLSKEDRDWVEEECRSEGISPIFSQTDGLFGNPEWWEIMIPLVSAAIPCITKILLKIIDNHGPTSITYGEITIDKVAQKDVPATLQKLSRLTQRTKEDSHD